MICVWLLTHSRGVAVFSGTPPRFSTGFRVENHSGGWYSFVFSAGMVCAYAAVPAGSQGNTLV